MLFLGLRGAIAFALSLHMEFSAEKRYILVTTTLIIVLFTIMCLGGATMPMMKVWSLFLKTDNFFFSDKTFVLIVLGLHFQRKKILLLGYFF